MPAIKENKRKTGRKRRASSSAYSKVKLPVEVQALGSAPRSEPGRYRLILKKPAETPYTAIVCDAVKGIKSQKPGANLSLDNMLSASHALSICQNGRVLNLDSYPEVVKKYVTGVVKSGNIDGQLKELNKQIVCRIGMEAT